MGVKNKWTKVSQAAYDGAMSKTLPPENLEFFLVALPGLEDVVAAEVNDWFPGLEAKVEHGGVTVFAPLGAGLAMNQALKTPTRILLRLKTFRCKDFPKLYNTITKLPWEQWIDMSCEMEVHVSTRLSRLKIKSRIEETCLDGWFEAVNRAGAKIKRGKKASLYVRFLNDECTLSLDTSGERLHKRGTREFIGEAPLRETIAAALIHLVESTYGCRDFQVEIVDPMMGSGTFLLEAADRNRLIEKREFAFENFAAQPKETPVLKADRVRVQRLIGYEADKKTIKAAEANLKKVEAGLQLELKDFFEAEPLPAAADPRWLFCNPPYGERLKVKEPLGALYERLFEASEKVARPERACYLLPSKAVKGKFRLPRGWKVLLKRPFVNGGIPVTAFVFGRA